MNFKLVVVGIATSLALIAQPASANVVLATDGATFRWCIVSAFPIKHALLWRLRKWWIDDSPEQPSHANADDLAGER